MHEAGHAVACVRLGVPFDRVDIGALGEPAGKAAVWTKAHSFPECSDAGKAQCELASYAKRCRNQVIVCFSGRIAEEKAALGGLTWGVGLSSGMGDERDARHFVREALRAQSELLRLGSAEPVSDGPTEELPEKIVSELAELRGEAEKLVRDNLKVIVAVAERLCVERA